MDRTGALSFVDIEGEAIGLGLGKTVGDKLNLVEEAVGLTVVDTIGPSLGRAVGV